MENNVENIQDKNIKKYVKKAVELYKWIKPLIYDYRQDLIAFRLTFLITIKLDLIAAIWNEIISQIETLKQQTGITEKPINLDIIPAKPQIQEKLPAVDISKVNIMAQSLQQPISEPKEVIKQVIENITPQITQQSEQNKTETNKTSFEFSYTFALFAFIFLFFIFLIIRR